MNNGNEKNFEHELDMAFEKKNCRKNSLTKTQGLIIRVNVKLFSGHLRGIIWMNN